MTETKAQPAEPWTILRLLQWTTEHLKKHGSHSPRLDAEVLLSHARGCERIQLYTSFAEEPDEPVKAVFRDLIKRRAAGEPVAYLVGKKEFYSISFHVSPECLIPRPETEHVVIECLDRAKKYNPDQPIKIVDVCTGSGCIAVSIAKHLERCTIQAIDISPSALAIARQNVEQHQLGHRIEIIEGNLLANLEPEQIDFVVSNPPYIADAEFESLEPSVRKYEPKLALTSGPIGTELIEQLIVESESRLKQHGWFICELSPMIADRVEAFLVDRNAWTDISMNKDLAGLKRIAVARRA